MKGFLRCTNAAGRKTLFLHLSRRDRAWNREGRENREERDETTDPHQRHDIAVGAWARGRLST